MALNERGVPPLLFLLCLSVPQLSGGGNTILYNFAEKLKKQRIMKSLLVGIASAVELNVQDGAYLTF